ncbi:hypothetical protein BDY24DRAFT_172452 [Mrakia frigida]|uniref:uncharacterized protein n=1 Tax=Mrakia frigida TaxID=29902 RepID=UPI003FCC143D
MPSAFVLSLLPYPFSLVFHHHVKTKSTTSSHANGSSSSSSSSSPPPPLPIGQRSFLERSFYQFGTHAAKHQIRVLLICCIVMTSLVYPALAIHYQTVSNPSSFSSTLRPNSLFNTPLLRPLFDDAGPTREFPFIRGLDFVAGNEDQEEGGVVLSEGGSSERSKGGGGAGGGVGGRVRMETIWIGEVSHLIASASPSAASLPGSALQPSSFDHEAFGAHLLAHVPTEFGLLFCSPSSTQPTPPDQPWAVWTCFLSEDGWEAVHWDEVAWKEILAGALEGLNGSATSWGRVDSDERSFLVDYSPSTTSSSNFTHPNHLASPSKIARLASAIPFPIILLYAFLLAWTFRALASFTPIHNQFGLAFTYVTELAISTVSREFQHLPVSDPPLFADRLPFLYRSARGASV